MKNNNIKLENLLKNLPKLIELSKMVKSINESGKTFNEIGKYSFEIPGSEGTIRIFDDKIEIPLTLTLKLKDVEK